MVIISQIYEPPLQYHYLKRPVSLIPMAAETMPVARAFDEHGNPVEGDAPAATSVYEIRIKSGIFYQPHPAFARDGSGALRYGSLSHADLRDFYTLSDFKEAGTRELIAADFVYQIKRLAHPRLHSPILGLISGYIVGLKELAQELRAANEALADAGNKDAWLDLSKYPLAGVEVVDRYTYRITLRGRYPQFQYWLAMNFFAPVPIEADRFYGQPGMAEKNLSLDWYPVGTGPYMLTENNPNARMVLERNPNYRGERYPAEGEPQDRADGLLTDDGKPIPFIEKVVFSRERESIPDWNKFLQGYYDDSHPGSDTFDQAVRVATGGLTTVTPAMAERGIKLKTTVAATTNYVAFNWLNPVVGGAHERARKLRRAIAIAVDQEEYVSIFANGQGIPAQGPIPPGIFGYRDGEAGIDPVVYDWVNGAPKRKPIEHARRLLAEAGYPDGRDTRTGEPLILYLDAMETGPDDKPRLDWYRKQFRKLDIQLEIRGSDFNRLQEKLRQGSAQIFKLNWGADYPDPENFLFLFHSSQSKVRFQGENVANYSNSEFDLLFGRMKIIENSPEREELIDRMVAILREDAPWLFGYHPLDYSLLHDWLANVKPHPMAQKGFKYHKIDAALREARRAEWNRPVIWPLALGALILALAIAPAVRVYRRRERATAGGS